MDSGNVADAAQGQIHAMCKGHIVDLDDSTSNSFHTTKASFHDPGECLEDVRLALGSGKGL